MASTTGNDRKDDSKLYMHKDAAECTAFMARVKAKVRPTDANAGKLAKLASIGDANQKEMEIEGFGKVTDKEIVVSDRD